MPARKKTLQIVGEAAPTPPPARPEQLLSAREVASILSVSKSAVWGLARRKEITRLKVGRATSFRESEIAALTNPERAAASPEVAS